MINNVFVITIIVLLIIIAITAGVANGKLDDINRNLKWESTRYHTFTHKPAVSALSYVEGRCKYCLWEYRKGTNPCNRCFDLSEFIHKNNTTFTCDRCCNKGDKND